MRIEKIIRKKNVKELLDNQVKLMSENICIENADGELLFGQPINAPLHKKELNIGNNTIAYLVANDLEKLNTFSNILEYILRNENEKKLVANETLEKYKEISLLYNMAENIATCLDFKGVAKLLMDEAIKLFNASGASVYTINPENNKFETLGSIGTDEESSLSSENENDFFKYIINQGKAELVNNIKQDQRFNDISFYSAQAVMCTPLIVRNRVMGLFNVSHAENKEFNAGDLKLLTTISFQAGIALENARLYKDLADTFFSTVQTLAESIEMKDPFGAGHARRVSNYSLAIAKELKCSPADMTRVKLASLLHDIGKIGISDEILLKNRDLIIQEQKIVEQHANYGSELLKHIKQLRDIVPAVRGHHERWDGKGYPDGLKGKEIPFIARLIAVADAYDNMISDRPYRKGLIKDEAIKQIRNASGHLYDPEIVVAFVNAIRRVK